MFEAIANPWEIEEADFPAHAGPAEKWRFLLAYTILAPSSHNTQPWRFTIRGSTLELFADRRRVLPNVDPEQRELIISCGAALYHLRVALRHFGYSDGVDLFPDPNKPDLLARVHMEDSRLPSREEDALFWAIPSRHTCRAPFEDRPIPLSVRKDLQMAAVCEGAWLRPLEDRARIRAAELIAHGTRSQWANPQFRHELAAWIHPRAAGDGLGGYNWGLRPLLIRSLDLGHSVASHDQQLAETAPMLAVLGTGHDHPTDWLRAGQALARVLLLASVNDLSASFLNQPIEVPDLRAELQTITEQPGFPQLMLRIGATSTTRPTPRRRVRDVID